jgi:uncharacterized protein with HEPN domain
VVDNRRDASPSVHAYFDTNLDILWTTAVEAAPAMLAQVKRILELH